jgi:TrmH family RNA methyltransferase
MDRDPLTAAEIKLYASLKTNKGRRESGLIIVEGINSVEALIASSYDSNCKFSGIKVFTNSTIYLEQFQGEIFEGAPIKALLIGDAKLERITKESGGVFAVAGTGSGFVGSGFVGSAGSGFVPAGLSVVLNNISDPGNLGTIIRASASLGAAQILLTGDTVDMYNPKVIRSTAGSIFRVPVYQDLDYYECLSDLKGEGAQIFAADLYGTKRTLPVTLESIVSLGVSGSAGKSVAAEGFVTNGKSVAVVFGNEANGLTSHEVDQCDKAVYIPMKSGVESMNLASSASIFIYEFMKLLES